MTGFQLVLHRMLYSCNHMATVGVKGGPVNIQSEL